MSLIVVPAHSPVKFAPHTRAAEIPPGHPFGEWSDADFQQFEDFLSTLHPDARDPASERAADRFALETERLASCDVCGEPVTEDCPGGRSVSCGIETFAHAECPPKGFALTADESPACRCCGAPDETNAVGLCEVCDGILAGDEPLTKAQLDALLAAPDEEYEDDDTRAQRLAEEREAYRAAEAFDNEWRQPEIGVVSSDIPF